MRLARQNTAPCGHRNPRQLTIVHAGHWECAFCAALRYFGLNQGAICEQARREDCEGRHAEAKACCEMALACGPCPAPARCRIAAAAKGAA